jgi:CTP synthase
MFSHVSKEQVICLADVSTLYKVPVMLKDLKIDEWFCERLALHEVKNSNFRLENKLMASWRDLANRYACYPVPCHLLIQTSQKLKFFLHIYKRAENLKKQVTIGLIGKYIRIPDTYASMIKALDHAALACNHKINIQVSAKH